MLLSITSTEQIREIVITFSKFESRVIWKC